jgi:hypothetical protein
MFLHHFIYNLKPNFGPNLQSTFRPLPPPPLNMEDEDDSGEMESVFVSHSRCGFFTLPGWRCGVNHYCHYCKGRRLCLRDQELLFSDLKFDGWNFTSRLVDLPTNMESHKTINKKTF